MNGGVSVVDAIIKKLQAKYGSDSRSYFLI